ncbi:virulence factor Mce family protein [Mycobacterium sp. AZCC_0083]|uniref:virulence factor Mce family protein n=1 Tax=Mycobacterium sp. AZCC_0083 TaxID=2735882 RepID=UPI00160F776B|nr:virulence factor Mce family protein [Mycobacterium sp. AZCC_0083]MBB5168318.1 phospholipid/cholesterol/gamma-HCH transport system substrate-binding protein [Mycobacterium sp. AZCC_0083]
MRGRLARIVLAVVLVGIVAGGGYLIVRAHQQVDHVEVTAYFDNSNGVFAGDDVRIRGVNVGKIEKIEPEPSRVKITFWVDGQYQVPADVKAVILSPTLVTARAVQLTPPYRTGPTLENHAVIPEQRTAVPVEWDDVRAQLQRLANTLQPTEPGGVSTLGSLVHTTADNLRGQGATIRDSIIKLSQTLSALGDHSGDIFSSVKNLSALVSALQDSTDLLGELNGNLASITALFANDPNEIANAISDLNDVVGEVKSFVAENRESLGTTTDKLASVSTALSQSLDDIKQALHILPTVAANAANLYQPAQGTLSGIAAVNNFSDPLTFLCGAIQAASRLGAEQSAKLCVQYLAPIVKNRQYNFPPLGFNPLVGASARPNELTYSEDWMHPDYIPPQATPPPAASLPDPAAAIGEPPLAAEAAQVADAPPARPTDPAAGLPGMMIPPGAGS